MIVFAIYTLAILYLILKNSLFGIFKDSIIQPKQIGLLFFLKILAIPVFYQVYQKIYGGIDNFDTGKFYNDAKVINSIAYKDFYSYVKLLFGFQNDTPGSYDFLLVKNTQNWDNGEIKDFLYNDNRILIRLHSIVHFFSFQSYFVHALFSCLISFTGAFYLYKTFHNYFKGKEIWFLAIACLFPALWFYTGALLKEGLSLFVLGTTLYAIKKLILDLFSLKRVFSFLFLLWLCLLLKPYLLVFAILCFASFFIIEKYWHWPLKIIPFLLACAGMLIVSNIISIGIKNKSLTQAALNHQRIFSGVSEGGIFLYNSERFVRLNYDTGSVQKINQQHSIYTIRKGISYMYWKNSVAHDTLYCVANYDTLTRYQLAYIIKPGGSNLKPVFYQKNVVSVLFNSAYYAMLFPFFYNCTGPLQYLASFENLFILISVLIVVFGFILNKQNAFMPFVFLIFALGICLLVGITTPNSGAIFRYRSPAVIFILFAAVYYLKVEEWKIFKRNH